MSKIAIVNGRVIDPGTQLDETGNVYVDDGKIISIAPSAPANFNAQHTIDASNHIVCPGFIELCARLREPGQENKATIASESTAAIQSGFTTLCIPPDTDPVIDEPAVVELIQKRAQRFKSPHILPLGAATAKLAGQQLSEMAALKDAGCVGVSNALNPIQDHRVLRRAMEYAATYGLVFHVVPLDAALANSGVAHEGAIATRLGVAGIPATAETVAIALYLELAASIGVKLHFGRISTARGVLLIEEAKAEGLTVTADVAIHNLLLNDQAINGFNSQAHVLPPLRSEDDRQGLIAGVNSGTIDAICADHQPHDADAKLNPFPATSPGISGLDTLLSLCLNLVDAKSVTLNRVLDAVTFQPAKILGADRGRLIPNAPADICIFDPNTKFEIEGSAFFSAGKNTPFDGWHVRGKVVQTIVKGEPMLGKF